MSASVWLEKFEQWKSIVKNKCSASAGPGGIFCAWIGRNCSYNDCPRRSLEEVYIKQMDDNLELKVEQLTTEKEQLTEQVEILTEKLKTFAPEEIEKIESVEAA